MHTMKTPAKNAEIRRAGILLVVTAVAASLLAPATAAQQQASVTAPAKSASATPPAAAPALTPEERHHADLMADADHLVELAQQLKDEIDKTNEYTLSLKAVKKAEEIQSSARALSQHLEQK